MSLTKRLSNPKMLTFRVGAISTSNPIHPLMECLTLGRLKKKGESRIKSICKKRLNLLELARSKPASGNSDAPIETYVSINSTKQDCTGAGLCLGPTYTFYETSVKKTQSFGTCNCESLKRLSVF